MSERRLEGAGAKRWALSGALRRVRVCRAKAAVGRAVCVLGPRPTTLSGFRQRIGRPPRRPALHRLPRPSLSPLFFPFLPAHHAARSIWGAKFVEC